MGLSQKKFLATAILQNIATLWNEGLPQGVYDGDDGEPEDESDPDPDVAVKYALR